jgi:hypothetical protein
MNRQTPWEDLLLTRHANVLERAEITCVGDMISLIERHGLQQVRKQYDCFDIEAAPPLRRLGPEAWGDICAALELAGFDWRACAWRAGEPNPGSDEAAV